MNHPDANEKHERTLLELCLDLRMAHNGSADPISAEEAASALAYLRYRIAQWKPSRPPICERFDDCVLGLCHATIAEGEWLIADTARRLER